MRSGDGVAAAWQAPMAMDIATMAGTPRPGMFFASVVPGRGCDGGRAIDVAAVCGERTVHGALHPRVREASNRTQEVTWVFTERTPDRTTRRNAR